MNLDLKNTDIKDLKLRAVELLAQGIIPYKNWAPMLIHPKLSDFPDIQAKAFFVWFPTMYDYLAGRNESRSIKNELLARQEGCENVFDLSEQLENCFVNVLSLYSQKEQIFIRDRRLQIVHGKLQISKFESHRIKIFNGSTKIVESVNISATDYRDILAQFYPSLSDSSKQLISRFLESEVFVEISDLSIKQLSMENHIKPLISRLGVQAQVGGR